MKNATEIMPLLFVGHGSPMNAIEQNEFTESWNKIGASLPKPKAILCISAHWETRGTYLTAMPEPRTIHDFGGFPRELYDVRYPAPGDPELANEIKQAVMPQNVELDESEWGLDHGAWSVIKHIYPNADIPVIQLSIDHYQPAGYHYELAKQLAFLRSKGVLIIGSGNIVHNLHIVDWKNPESGYDWAIEANYRMKKYISNGNHQQLIDFRKQGKAFELAIPTSEHYIPLLYIIALQNKSDKITFFNDKLVMGSLSMTSVMFG
jgi:4,5-DOPA dioxygenase extradiol